jgi:NAD(P)-dependent dehydrogenase (short-subunit alcohol dehydrogenase family)
MDARVAVVSDGSYGLGLQIVAELARSGMRVVLACRRAERGREAIDLLGDLSDRVAVRALDTRDVVSIAQFALWLRTRLKRCDVLVNVVGSADNRPPPVVLEPVQTREADLLGIWQLAQAVAPLMRARRYGRIVNVGVTGAVPSRPLGALTRFLAEELHEDGILVNACRVESASVGTPQAVETPVWLATLPDSGPTGECHRDRNDHGR